MLSSDLKTHLSVNEAERGSDFRAIAEMAEVDRERVTTVTEQLLHQTLTLLKTKDPVKTDRCAFSTTSTSGVEHTWAVSRTNQRVQFTFLEVCQPSDSVREWNVALGGLTLSILQLTSCISINIGRRSATKHRRDGDSLFLCCDTLREDSVLMVWARSQPVCEMWRRITPELINVSNCPEPWYFPYFHIFRRGLLDRGHRASVKTRPLLTNGSCHLLQAVLSGTDFNVNHEYLLKLVPKQKIEEETFCSCIKMVFSLN